MAQLAFHVHPKIIEMIQARNREEYDYFAELFADKIDIGHYLFDGSACVFPGVKRYVGGGGRGKRDSYNADGRAIIDSNEFPRHLWCFLKIGKGYNGPNWKNSGLNEFELAHVFAHKESELEFEKQFFASMDKSLQPYGDFTCACNVVLLPRGTVKPTDKSEAIKAAFYKRYVCLYGESPLNGRSGFNDSLVPDWYDELEWNEIPLPPDWELNIEKLLEYRTKRITDIMRK